MFWFYIYKRVCNPARGYIIAFLVHTFNGYKKWISYKYYPMCVFSIRFRYCFIFESSLVELLTRKRTIVSSLCNNLTIPLFSKMFFVSFLRPLKLSFCRKNQGWCNAFQTRVICLRNIKR